MDGGGYCTNTKSGRSERNDYERLWGIEKNPELCFYDRVVRIFVALLAFTLNQSAWATKPVVAVFEIKNEARLKRKFVKQLRDLVAAELTKNNTFSVVPNFEIQKALREKQADSYKQCYDESCQIEIGKEIAAEMTLATAIKKLGSQCIITMQLFDLRSGASSKSGTARGSCGEDSVVESLFGCTAQITGASKSPIGVARSTGPSFSSGQVTEAKGRLIVEGSPKGASVEVKGPQKYLEVLALPASLDSLVPGSYSVKVTANGYVEKELKTNVQADQTEVVRIALDLLAKISIRGTPAGAKVELFDAEGTRLATGSFPLSGNGIRPGTYRVKVSRAGYVSYEKEHILTAGNLTQIQVDLLNTKSPFTKEVFQIDKDLPDYQRETAQDCVGGNRFSCMNFAKIYVEGLGVKKNRKRAGTIYKTLCDEGYQTACGESFYYGVGTPMDHSKAAAFYRKACDGQEMGGCYNLGYMHKKGQGVGKDLGRALSLYRKACDGGEMLSCQNLALMYKRGNGVGKDLGRALSLYRKACDGGNMGGCYNLAVMYDNGEGVGKDLGRAISLYRKACDGGDMSGCYNLAIEYDRGEGIGKDLGRALSLYRKACDGGAMLGCNNLGYMYHYGQGVAKDLSRAASLYKKACDGGSNIGCKNLKKL